MSTQFILPKPRDWNTFEEIVADVFSRKFENYNFQRYGRAGQSQDGVDVAGPTNSGRIIGIQCKHHPEGDIATAEIDKEILKSEGFSPPLSEYFIATSAKKDKKATKYVLEISRVRIKQGTYPVNIIFWEDICGWLSEYPDLVYKYFTRYFPTRELESLSLPGITNSTKTTLTWPVTTKELQASTDKNLASLHRVGPYHLTLGLTTFPNTSFDRRTDLEISLAAIYASEIESTDRFAAAVDILKAAKAVISSPSFSNNLTVHIQTRLTVAFLFGWLFRRVSSYNLLLIHHNDLWATTNFPSILPGLVDDFPLILDKDSSEVALVFSITRDISQSVAAGVERWPQPPKAVLNYRIEGHVIQNAAHALSLSLALAHKIKNLIDWWQVTHIHLFGAMPAALALMIAHNLNAICPISLYYLGEDRQTYHIGGTLYNGL